MASLTFYGGVSEIGGNRILLDAHGTRLFLDFGLSFDRKSSFYEEFLQPRTNNGLRDLMAFEDRARVLLEYGERLIREGNDCV